VGLDWVKDDGGTKRGDSGKWLEAGGKAF